MFLPHFPSTMPAKKGGGGRFPAARIKKMIQADDDVGKVASSTPIVLGKALELFLEGLVKECVNRAEERKTKKVASHHVKRAVLETKEYDFCADVVANVNDPVEKDDENEGGKKAKGKGKGKGKVTTKAKGKAKAKGKKRKNSDDDSDDDEEDGEEDDEEEHYDEDDDDDYEEKPKPAKKRRVASRDSKGSDDAPSALAQPVSAREPEAKPDVVSSTSAQDASAPAAPDAASAAAAAPPGAASAAAAAPPGATKDNEDDEEYD